MRKYSAMPDMQDVDSEGVGEIGYDPLKQELHVRFRESGNTYVYFPVKGAVYAELLHAESIGNFVNTQIKPNYKYRLLRRST